ncbi:MAG: tRNA (guanosine(46)-N7)-methyltransferase TrmB [Deltaproteobacteria bacterium]|nr:tRNA (guanosine(46)-N7)-methyltransferase TrmB [Deltaproteobacteria bacterium]
MGRGDWKRSYRHDEGRRTTAQRRALRELWEPYGLSWTWDRLLDLDAAFGREGPAILDLGFGTGESLVAAARRHPDHRVLGVEVYRPGLGAALLAIEREGLENVRVVRGDAFELLTHHIAPATFALVQIFFPEPWPEFPERRIVRPLLLELLARTLEPGGLLHLATDVPAYLDHARAAIEAASGWTLVEDSAEEPGHPDTVYARRARDEGRPILQLRARREP